MIRVAALAAMAQESERHLQRDFDDVEPLSEKNTCSSPGEAQPMSGRESFRRLMRVLGEDDLIEQFRLRAGLHR